MKPELITIKKVLNAVEEKTALKFRHVGPQPQHPNEICITLTTNDVNRDYTVVFRKQIDNNQILGITLNAMKHLKYKGVIIAEYIAPMIAERLREMGIHFLDAAGNAFINEPPIYVYINGNKPQLRTTVRQPKPYYAAALKVIFPLLCRPELVNVTLRELARGATVALGTVGNVMDELRTRKHIVVTADGKPHLTNLKTLFQQWVMLYPTVLRPKLLLGKYAAPQDGWWENAALPDDMLWAGEVGAGKLTQYLKAPDVTIYAHGKIAQFLVKHRLKENPGGKVEILRTFWNQELQLEKNGVAPALLVYADLIATGEPRNIEVAELIYEKELTRHFDKF